jgi:apolipoprotein N-acyltransferase
VFWVAAEQLRSLAVLGFTWGALGHVGGVFPRWVQFASITGVLGVSFWIVLVNVLVLRVLLERGRRRIGPAAAAAVVLAVPWFHGGLVMGAAAPAPSARVAVIQPNISAEKKWDARFKQMSFDVLRDLTLEASQEHPDLVVWPETAAPSYLLEEPEDLARVANVAREAGTAILTGCPDLEIVPGERGGARVYNAAILVLPSGVVADRYAKIHLVPFGEFIPFETVLPILKRVDFGEADFSPGKQRVVFATDRVRFSVLVCFESIFPRLARQFVADGAELLVNITNDVWYGRTSMPFQHAGMAPMRAIENRRSLARSANSGVSLLCDPFGRILGSLPIFERGYLVADLPLVAGRTFYTRHGDVFSWAATALAGIALATAWARGRRVGRRPRRAASSGPVIDRTETGHHA